MTLTTYAHRLRSCDKKVRYHDRIQGLFASIQHHQRMYRCGFCRGYHLTSKKR